MKFLTKGVLASLALAFVVFTMPATAAESRNGHAYLVDGIAIYLGVMPAEMLLGYPAGSAERKMHGGVPLGDHWHHVMIVLFDKATGQRIDNAKVTATVGEIGSSVVSKPLEHMTIGGFGSYGNYFEMPRSAVYSINLQIQIPGKPETLTAVLHYRHLMH